ncbi:MAG: bifunctional diguanylate cyclase/phosphodiesterase [Spirulinaceae cyanobacterium]
MNNDNSWIAQQPRNLISLYFLLSSVWILLFDLLLQQLIDDLELLSQIQNVRSWIFVVTTGLFVYLLLRWRVNNKKSQKQETLNQNQNFSTRLQVVNNYPCQSLKKLPANFREKLQPKNNLTSCEQLENELKRVALHDSLTGLPNKTWFLQHLETLLKSENNQDKKAFAVVFINLDRFAKIKYSLGHQVAEQLIPTIAKEVQAFLSLNEPIARVGDKALAILWQEQLFKLDAISLAKLISTKLNSPLKFSNHEIYSPVSVGIAFGNKNSLEKNDFSQPEDWLDAADTAMNYAKVKAKSGYAVFKPQMHQQAVARLQLETDLRRGIQDEQLKIVYQPIVSLKTGTIIGFEALVRWKHPTEGWISPNEFIPLAEESDLISAIDWWILEKACQQISAWQREGKVTDSFAISVNMSGQMLYQIGMQFRLESILAQTKIRKGSLKLEITERVMMKHNDVETGMLQQLKSMGIKLSIDDFGTGYSCLERLHQMPIDTLKIDRSFINRMDSDEESLEIIRTIITLAHGLEMDVIAEGIEEAEQISQLLWLQCEYGQGYLFSKPLQGEAAEKLLSEKLYW